MQTLFQKFHSFKKALLHQYPEEEAGEIAKIVFTETLRCSFLQLTLNWKELLEKDSEKKIDTILEKLLTGEPLQHVLGYAWFYGEQFEVNGDVLIPRRETEELVELIIQKEKGKKNLHLVDIGCGSGCISITLFKNLPGITVNGIDVSENALLVSRKNAETILGKHPALSFVHADILDASQWPEFPALDVVVSNPPYITEKEKEDMLPHVLDHEPHLALFVANDDPLLFYRAIADFGLEKLKPGGRLYLEINEHFGIKTAEMLKEYGFDHIAILADMQGKDRMIFAVKPA